VTGSGFAEATKVTFGTLAGKNLVVANDHTITVRVTADLFTCS
jgi:hypothetical protein